MERLAYNQVTVPQSVASLTTSSSARSGQAITSDEAQHSSSDRTLASQAPEQKEEEKQDKQEDDREDEQEQEQEQKQEEKSNGGDEENNIKIPPLPVGFWHESLKEVRKQVVGRWALTTLILFVFIITVLSLYWAVLYRVTNNIRSLTIAVVNFDGAVAPYTGVRPVIGQAVEQAVRKLLLTPKGVLGYQLRSPSEFDFSPIAVRQYVYDQHAWAAIVVNPNATALLQSAVATGNTSYDPLGALQMIYVQARDETTYSNYILPQLQALTTEIQSQFGQQWISTVLSNTSLSASTYSNAPQALSPAIGVSIFNLRPFEPPQATPAVTIGLIYLIIIAFFNFSFYLPIHMRFLIPQGHPPIHFYQLCAWRLGTTILAYFFLSLAYSLVSLAFQIPFSNTAPHPDTSVVNNADAFGKASFVVYWMLNFIGMYALGLASENVTMVIGQPWTAMWLIFWVITNVSTSFYAIELAPGFFRWGLAWPLHNIVEASRTIVFDTHSRLGLNFGILMVWCAIHTILFFPCALIMRWKSQKEVARAAPRPTIKYLVDG